MDNFPESGEGEGTSSIVPGDLSGGVQNSMESPTLLEGQVVMETTQATVMDTDPEMIAANNQCVAVEGTQHGIEGSQVMIKGSGVIMQENNNSAFGSSVLPNDDGASNVDIGDAVIVKQEDLGDSRYGHNQQILGLVSDADVTDDHINNIGADMTNTAGLEDQEGEMLLQNLVNTNFHTSAGPTQGHDKIVVMQTTYPSASVMGATPVNDLHGIGNNMSTVSTTPTRIVVQTNQSSPVKSSSGHVLIQVGGNPVSVASQQMVSVGNKNHIVIRSGNAPAPTLCPPESMEEAEGSAQGGVFKVIIPEGTTKYKKPMSSPVSQNEPVRKHVQINLSDRNAKKPGPTRYVSHTSQTPGRYDGTDAKDMGGNDAKRYYECPTCNSKFMRPLFLRKHMRSCKKEEVKVEKSPLYMCSFCKMTFKTRPQISQHFLKCFHNPYSKKNSPVKRKGGDLDDDGAPPKKGRMDTGDLDPALEQAVQFRCQDCDRTFNKERQYSSHIKKCTKISVHDLSGARQEAGVVEEEEEEPDLQEDPFADPDPPVPVAPKRGRGPGRRGRPPGRVSAAASRGASKSSTKKLFQGAYPLPSSRGLLVADNEGLVRSTTGLAHTLQLSLETASLEKQPQPAALVADSKGVRGRDKPPQAWSLVCALCQKMFITKAALAHHVVSEHGPDLSHMRNILEGKVQDSQPLYRCPLCNLNYANEEQALEHMVLQHTARLQETFTRLQGETATFVCSLCSLVLLTRNLLVEHMSLVHLEELETLAKGDTYVSIPTKTEIEYDMSPTSLGTEQQYESSTLTSSNPSTNSRLHPDGVRQIKTEGNLLECGFCGEESQTEADMVDHYVEVHGVETDEEGCLMDLGIDVDVRVKDTKSLLQLADGQIDNTIPEKTVLLRKKPRQSWQCKECQQVFNKHFDYLRHIREVCTDDSHSNKSSTPKSGNFKCQEPGCSHLSFYQVKLLFKHMEEVHKVVVPREFKTFKSLHLFYEWLTGEEKKYSVRYIKDTTRIEKQDMKLVQMVCHRFHTAKIDNCKEKKEDEVKSESPSKLKRRWFVRIQRSSNCHARIHLKVQYNPVTEDYDGETQIVYYPQHTHSDGDLSQDIMKRIMERHVRDPSYLSRNGNHRKPKQHNSVALQDSKSESQNSNNEESMDEMLSAASEEVRCQQVVVSGSVNAEETLTVDQYMKEFCQTQLEGEVDGTSLVVSTSSRGTEGTTTVLQAGRQQRATSSILMESDDAVGGSSSVFNDNSKGSSSVLMESGEPGTYVVQDGVIMEVAQGESDQKEDATEEYILPADDAEWTKLFDVLRVRLMTSELNDQEKAEGEGLLSYQTMIPILPLGEQVSIFQQLCLLTNTAIETAE